MSQRETGVSNSSGQSAPITERLARKVRRSRFALFVEKLWPRLWLVIGVVGLFVLFSLTGIWPLLSRTTHLLTLGAFATLLLVSLAWAARTPWPGREAALRRLEQRSGAPHRPATAYEDTLTAGADDERTQALWQAHRRRLARTVDGLSVGAPEPRIDRNDPWALRVVLMLLVLTGLAFVGDSARDRLASAFHLDGGRLALAAARLDAWITPPAYTARPPVMLADGGLSLGKAASNPAAAIEVPEKSILVARLSVGGTGLSVELVDQAGNVVDRMTHEPVTDQGSQPKGAGADSRVTGAGVGLQSAEVKAVLKRGVTGARVMLGGNKLAQWKITVIPDNPPKIALTKEVEKTIRGGMKMHYRVTDDFGVASAEARFEALPPDEGDPRTQWARPDVLKGPRLPLDRPPQFQLRLPAAQNVAGRSAGAKNTEKPGEAWSFHELGNHPWAGMRVQMTLIARDHAGNVGTSPPIEMVLPERQFRNPLARAVIEQRRRLVTDSRYRDLVRQALAALTIEPDGFINDRAVYLGLRSVYHRLREDHSRAGLTSMIEQLWHIAQRIEDGRGLSEAERRLREIQDKLSQAIQNGASQEEIKKLMDELRQAMAEFMNQLARQAERNPQTDMPQGMNPSQFMRPEDLERMLQNLENMARQGSKDAAQEMLSQLRDLLDRLQSGRMANQGQMGQQGRQMMEMMNQFGNLIGEQQRLMDDTFGQQRRQDGGEDEGQQGQGQQGQGQQGQQGQGQQGQGQRGQRGQGRGSPDALGQRQGQLGQTLDRLRQQLQQFGMRAPGQLDGAREAMENAERALREGDLDEATREQGRALEQLRQGAQSMAEQMLQRMPSRFGRAGDAPLDPLGRPQRSEGPDLGTSVKVPEEIDTQRAREILEELRRRLGERFRPDLELDYLERLLKRF